MNGEINKPTNPTYFLAYSVDGTRHIGITEPNQVTSTGQETLTYDDDPSAFLDAIKDVETPDLIQLPDAPQGTEQGEWVDRGVYQWGDLRVVCIQAHNRTIYEPTETPALFAIQNLTENWIAGEQVAVGDERNYEGTTYKCLQSHTTQTGWEPPNVPALWEVAGGV